MYYLDPNPTQMPKTKEVKRVKLLGHICGPCPCISQRQLVNKGLTIVAGTSEMPTLKALKKRLWIGFPSAFYSKLLLEIRFSSLSHKPTPMPLRISGN